MITSVICILAIVSLAAPGTTRAADEEGFVSMFNGKDLAGWEGKPGAWWVEDAAITGESTKNKPCPKTHYLVWKGGRPADFVLRLKIKLSGGNSGIQFRSAPRPDFNTVGYQADFDAKREWAGCLFQEQRGAVVKRGQRATISKDGKRKETSFASSRKLARKIKNNDWNDYEIVAKGSRIALRINGQLMCEVDDRDARFSCRKGIIALQMHKGPRMKVQFKDLRIKVLK